MFLPLTWLMASCFSKKKCARDNGEQGVNAGGAALFALWLCMRGTTGLALGGSDQTEEVFLLLKAEGRV